VYELLIIRGHCEWERGEVFGEGSDTGSEAFFLLRRQPDKSEDSVEAGVECSRPPARALFPSVRTCRRLARIPGF
jgi:hypothetical protein